MTTFGVRAGLRGQPGLVFQNALTGLRTGYRSRSSGLRRVTSGLRRGHFGLRRVTFGLRRVTFGLRRTDEGGLPARGPAGLRTAAEWLTGKPGWTWQPG